MFMFLLYAQLCTTIKWVWCIVVHVMSERQSQTDDLNQMSPIAVKKLRNATVGDEVWLHDRKTPIIIDNRRENGDRVEFIASGNGYDYFLTVASSPYEVRGECVRWASRGNGENLTDDVQGVRHVEDDQ